MVDGPKMDGVEGTIFSDHGLELWIDLSRGGLKISKTIKDEEMMMRTSLRSTGCGRRASIRTQNNVHRRLIRLWRERCRGSWSFARVQFPLHVRGTRKHGPYGGVFVGTVGAPLADARDTGRLVDGRNAGGDGAVEGDGSLARLFVMLLFVSAREHDPYGGGGAIRMNRLSWSMGINTGAVP
jgi:hypothetical protein